MILLQRTLAIIGYTVTSCEFDAAMQHRPIATLIGQRSYLRAFEVLGHNSRVSLRHP